MANKREINVKISLQSLKLIPITPAFASKTSVVSLILDFIINFNSSFYNL